LVGLPVHRVRLTNGDAEWTPPGETDDRVGSPTPFFKVRADVQRYTNQRCKSSATVGAVHQHTWKMTRVHRGIALLDAGHEQIRRALMFRGIRSGSYEARRQVEDGVDRVRVVDPICADQRGINRAGLLAGEEVMEKIVAGKQVCERRLRPSILITN